MIRIAVVDDEKAICDELLFFLQEYEMKFKAIFDISIYYNGENLLADLEDDMRFDLILLDIELAEINGVEVGRYIRNKNQDYLCQIIYISSKMGYAMELFQVHPFHFLIKPIQKEMLFSCLEEYVRLYSKKDFFELTNKNIKKRIPIEQIQYFESSGRKIIVYCINESYEFYGKLSDLSEMRILKNFLMIHKSFYVNISHISEYNYKSLTIDDDKTLPISQPNRTEVRRALLTNIIPLIALSFLYESKVTSKLFVGLSFYVVNMLADGIVYTVILITKVDSIVMSSGIATVLVTFLIELIFEYVWKKRSYHEIDKLYLMTILAVPIGSILIGVLTMYQYSIKTIIVAFVLMSFNLLIFYMYDNLQKNYEVIYEKKLLEQAVEAQHSELELLQEFQNKIRYLQHDFKNHLISIVNYAKKADNQGLIHYIEEGLGFLSLHQQFVDTGNSEIDSILNYKLQEMKNKNVHLKYSITIPKDLKINVFDLNIILGNLLNNAIEAIEKAERKYFFINIYFEKNILFIHIENTYDGNIIKEKETLMTTKEEKQLHGLGLKSVSSILEKYDGDIIYDYNDIYFITDVMLCNTSFHHETE